MSMSRRGLLETGATVLASLAAAPLLSACGERLPAELSLPQQGLPSTSLAAYQKMIGTSFQVAKPAISLQLVAVSDLSRPGRPEQGEVFAMTFAGPSNGPTTQDSYSLDHSRLGTGSLLLVPAGTRQDGALLYSAIINHQSL